jgi:hypothetical protein
MAPAVPVEPEQPAMSSAATNDESLIMFFSR